MRHTDNGAALMLSESARFWAKKHRRMADRAADAYKREGPLRTAAQKLAFAHAAAALLFEDLARDALAPVGRPTTPGSDPG